MSPDVQSVSSAQILRANMYLCKLVEEFPTAIILLLVDKYYLCCQVWFYYSILLLKLLKTCSAESFWAGRRRFSDGVFSHWKLMSQDLVSELQLFIQAVDSTGHLCSSVSFSLWEFRMVRTMLLVQGEIAFFPLLECNFSLKVSTFVQWLVGQDFSCCFCSGSNSRWGKNNKAKKGRGAVSLSF